MDDKKSTLYLALLCIILVIWGSVLDGKRIHVKEVLEAENAELLTQVQESQANFDAANAKQSKLARKLKQVKRELTALKARNRELQKLNEELRAELQKIRILKEEAEKKQAEALKAAEDARVNAGKGVVPSPAGPTDEGARIHRLEQKLDQLIRERDELRSKTSMDTEKALAASLAVSDLESQLRFCREQIRQYQQDARETRDLKSRIRQLEWELSSRTQELWDTRLNLSADLDACTRRLMQASLEGNRTPPPHHPPAPCVAKKMKRGGGMEGGPPCKKGGEKCRDCPRVKQLEAKLQAYSTRIEALQHQLYNANLQSLQEIEQLKRALKEQSTNCLHSIDAAEDLDTKIQGKNSEIEKLKAEIREKETELLKVREELEQYKKNTEALLEQIRQQRALIKKLKSKQ